MYRFVREYIYLDVISFERFKFESNISNIVLYSYMSICYFDVVNVGRGVKEDLVLEKLNFK